MHWTEENITKAQKGPKLHDGDKLFQDTEVYWKNLATSSSRNRILILMDYYYIWTLMPFRIKMLIMNGASLNKEMNKMLGPVVNQL